MEGNAKPLLHWDWDSPTGFFGADYKHSITSSGLELRNGSSLRSTISVSADSSTKVGKDSSGFCVDNSMSKDVGSCFPLLMETRQEDLPINLKLCKRNYLDNDSVESREERNTMSQLASVRQVPARVVRKTRISQQCSSSISCQVDGCSEDLSTAKDYHRKHRVCPAHSKSFRVIIAGLERRFCQQCSRFQALSEFDDKKRSCRKRLSNHNARRRKPQPEIISFNSSIFASSAYESQQINFLPNKPPSGCLISNASTTWQSSYDYGLPHEKEPWLMTTKEGRVDGSVNFQSMQLSNGTITHSREINVQFPFRGTSTKVHQGSGTPIVASNMDRAPDLQRARSLLSAGSWVSAEPRQTSSFTPIAQSNNNGALVQHMMQSVNSTSGYWQDRKPQSKQARHFPFHPPDDDSQLHKAPPF